MGQKIVKLFDEDFPLLTQQYGCEISCKSPFEDLFIRVSNSKEGQMAAILTERVWPPPSLRKSENKNELKKADMNHGGFFVVFSLIYQTKVQQYEQAL